MRWASVLAFVAMLVSSRLAKFVSSGRAALAPSRLAVLVSSRLAVLVAAVTACDPAPTQPPVTTAIPTEPTPPDEPATPPPLHGAPWESASCGERTYPRTLELREDGSFLARDLVSPCPEGATCVWSGIVERAGTYTASADRITLVRAGNEPAPAAKALPDALQREPSGAPAEVDAGGARCVYTRAP